MARIFRISILIVFAFFPCAAGSVELGLTPNHVFGLWTNVNSCLTAIAGQTQDAPSMVARVEALGAQTFTGKTPGDVLERVAEVRNRVNALRSRAGSDAVRVFDDHSGTVTPSVVFLNSGYVLDGLADWLARRDNPSVRVMTCYQPRNFSSKTPSDVFGLVDLAMRRADLVFAR